MILIMSNIAVTILLSAYSAILETQTKIKEELKENSARNASLVPRHSAHVH